MNVDDTNPKATLDRRNFLGKSLLYGSAVPYVFSSVAPAFATGAESKNDRIRLGLIGCGPQGHNSIRFTTSWFDVVAVADVYEERRERSKNELSGGKAAAHNDYRRVLESDDVDAVYIATPDHWHAKQLIEALHAGKDAFCEKPLTLTIDEGKAILRAQQETGRVVQVGTQQRSMFDLFVKAVAIIAEGRIGKIQSISAQINGGPMSPSLPAVPPPAGLDWDRWLGPAPKAEYRFLANDNRDYSNCFYDFRWWLEYSGGKLTDWGAHHVDIACWALRANGQSDSPTKIEGSASYGVDYKDGYPVQNDRYNTAAAFKFDVTMTDGVKLTIRNDGGNGILFQGDKGRLFVNRGRLAGKPVEALAESPLPEDAIAKVYRGFPMVHEAHKGHWFNFYNCIRDRKEPISDVATHMRGLNLCHLAGICGRLGRPLHWDGESNAIVGDEQAQALLSRPYREGYGIEA